MSTFEDRPTGIGVRGVQTLARMLLDSVSALNGTGPTAELAEAWIAAVDREWPLSFENVCETLGVDPDALRAALLAPAHVCCTEGFDTRELVEATALRDDLS